MTFTAKQIRTGRRWAYITMLAMLALSVAGNLAHTYHINPDPSVRALVYAIMWPLMVWAGVELFVRLPWQAVLTHRLVRWVGILLVAAIAALVSYRHLRGLLVADGEEWTVYTFGPLAVDGLMLMSTLGLLLTRSLKGTDETPDLQQDLVESSRKLVARIGELERELDARDALAQIHARPTVDPESDSYPQDIPASQEVQEIYHGPEMTLADVLPAPVSPAPAIPGLSLGPVQKLEGWTPPQPLTAAPRRTRATKWDEAKARELLLAGGTKASVSAELNVSPKTIQRLRARMVEAGELTA
jgi:uncharacterized protein DUF2637